MATFYIIRQHDPLHTTYFSEWKPTSPYRWNPKIEAAIHFPDETSAHTAARLNHFRSYDVIPRTI